MARTARLGCIALASLAIALLPSASRTAHSDSRSVTLAFHASLPGVAADSPALGAAGETTPCDGGGPVVAIVIDPPLAAAIRGSLTQFDMDLCDAGYEVIEKRAVFASPPELRDYLAGLHTRTGGALAGTILVGNIPHAYQWIEFRPGNPAFPPTLQEVISFQYYADLDGSFARSPGYVSPSARAHSFDLHTGMVDWEIWVGVLPTYNGSFGQTVSALERYFTRNHAFRATAPRFEREFLEVNEHFAPTSKAESDLLLAGLINGQYAWTPLSAAPSAGIYFESPFGGLSINTGYAHLADGGADLTVVDAHGFWGASGQLSIADVESAPVRTSFFWSNGCAVGDIDKASNFLTSVVYSPTSSVLVAKGTTNDSGGMGTNTSGFFGHNVATAMVGGQSIGEAVVGHVNVPLIWPWSLSREFHYATPILIGDPTLQLPSARH